MTIHRMLADTVIPTILLYSHLLTAVACLLLGPALLSVRSYLPIEQKVIQRGWSAFSVLVLLFGASELGAVAYQIWAPGMLIYGAAKCVTAVWAVGAALYWLFYLQRGLVEAFRILEACRQGELERAVASRAREAVSDAPEGIVYVDTEGQVVEANRCFARWLQTTPERLEGRLVTDFVHSADAADVTALLRRIFQSRNPARLIPSSTRFVGRDGSVVQLWWQRGTRRLSRWGCLRLATTPAAANPPPPTNGEYVSPPNAALY